MTAARRLVDAAFLAALVSLAVLGFRSTYTGSGYLVAGLTGLAAGLVAAYALRRQPAVTVGALVVVLYFPLAWLAVRPGSVSAAAVREVAAAGVLAWKQVLTTLAPVDRDGPLLVVPLIVGLAAGSVGLSTAVRVRPRPGSRSNLLRAVAPAIVATSALGVVVALGTAEPGAWLLDGSVFAAIALWWTAVRWLPTPHGRRSRVARPVLAAVILGAAGLAAVAVEPVLPGSPHREVLRDYVVPPFDLSAYPSPLVGFRKYTKDAHQLYDQALMRVSGLPPDTPIRFATLDDYDGSVWGASNAPGSGGFQRVGTRIGPPGGSTATVKIAIEPAYAAASDVDAWLPVVGDVREVQFSGVRSQPLAQSLRYNLGASAAIVTARLQAGDTVSLSTSRVAVDLPDDVQPFGRPALSETAQALLSSRVATWTRGVTGLAAQLKAVATQFRDHGAYTDGGPGETQYLPGHSLRRLADFFNGDRPIGDDEQYAAAYALVANYLGIPARVVVGAQPSGDGAVRGADVHAWVEVHLADGRWAGISQTAFMPDKSHTPDKLPPQEQEDANAAVVPPPNIARRPVTTVDSTDSVVKPERPQSCSWLACAWPFIWAALKWCGPPLLLIALIVGAVTGLKAARRRRRMRRGPPANRLAGAWHELVDAARDAGHAVPNGFTRDEQCVALSMSRQGRRQLAPAVSRDELARLAGIADLAVYGPGDPSEADIRQYWTAVDSACRTLSGPDRITRARARLSLRSLRAVPPAQVPALAPKPLVSAAERGAE